jgi:hypothetical protein
MMQQLIMPMYLYVLFVVLSPGALFCLVPKGSDFKSALVHGVLFVVVFHLTNQFVFNTFTPYVA